VRELPLGSTGTKETLQAVKSQVYDDIKRELMEGKPEDILMENEYDILAPDIDNYDSSTKQRFERRGEKILREFGW
jgi:hypothetical protein